MLNKLYFLVPMVLMSFNMTASAQHRASDRIKPKWLHALPVPSNSSFVYITQSASAGTLRDAKQECFSELVAAAGLEKGITTKVDYKSSEQERLVWHNDKKNEYVESRFLVNSTIQGKPVTLHALVIDEYEERKNDGKIYLTTLYARSQIDAIPSFDNITVTDNYGARGLWRSAIIPGWGQFHKGANLKGGLILGGCAALAAGIVFTENQRSDYVRKIGKTHSAELKRTYATKRDHFATGRNICIGAIAALYVYNLIDAVAAPGARRIVVHPRSGGRGTYAFAPAILDDGAPALAASVTF